MLDIMPEVLRQKQQDGGIHVAYKYTMDSTNFNQLKFMLHILSDSSLSQCWHISNTKDKK